MVESHEGIKFGGWLKIIKSHKIGYCEATKGITMVHGFLLLLMEWKLSAFGYKRRLFGYFPLGLSTKCHIS